MVRQRSSTPNRTARQSAHRSLLVRAATLPTSALTISSVMLMPRITPELGQASSAKEPDPSQKSAVSAWKPEKRRMPSFMSKQKAKVVAKGGIEGRATNSLAGTEWQPLNQQAAAQLNALAWRASSLPSCGHR